MASTLSGCVRKAPFGESLAFRPRGLGAECGVEFVTWLGDHRPELLERVTFVSGEHLDRCPVGYGGCTVDYPVIHKPFELNALASYIDSAGNRAQT